MMTLLDEIKAIIADRGPITVEQYMQLALAHPELGYYMNRDPFGATGDFTTAPEISQMFGELIGLWAAEVWSSMGSPRPVRLVELGPGRGTLMSDALRAARIAPPFRDALDVWLVETSPTLAAIQHELLLDCGAPVAWAQSLKDIPEGPAIVIGNEFLDALPVRQFVRVGGQWRERTVGLNDEGDLAFGVAASLEPYISATAQNGEIIEVNPAGHRLMFELGARLVKQGGAALLIDYGHAVTSFGDTLQAVRAHRYVDPLAAPGDCDLTAHVDFAAMARSARATGAVVYGPIDQGDFLRAIGIDLRTKALAERAGPERSEALQQARNRLVGKAKGEMGASLQGDGGRRPQAAAPARLPAERGEDGVSAPFLSAGTLRAPGVSHAFFTRHGGVSEGVYASLNGGVGSRDAPEAVAENRARMAAALGVAPQRLAIPYQVHSPDAVAVAAHWAPDARPRCDGIVTATPGLALGVTGADCGMILFADARARVVGAAHAGWKGALTGVIEATVAAMERLGARRDAIAAALGPCIAQGSYEVGPNSSPRSPRPERMRGASSWPSRRAGHSMFDLKGYIADRADRAGVGRFEDLRLDTYADEDRFFSYRRTTHRKEPDYGRLVSAIVLT